MEGHLAEGQTSSAPIGLETRVKTTPGSRTRATSGRGGGNEGGRCTIKDREAVC